VCFSPQADVVGGLVICAIGIDAVRHIRQRREFAALGGIIPSAELELIGGVLAVARNDQHAPPGEAHDDANEQQRCHSQGGTGDLDRRAAGDKRESAQHDQTDAPPAQAARTRALASAGAPSCAVPRRHRLRILRGWAKAAATP
jgi:hypothetical protein